MRSLVLARADDPRPGLRWDGGEQSWSEVVADAAVRAAWLRRQVGPQRAHVGVLLENTPEFARWLVAAALSGDVVVGLNHTRRGDELVADIRATDCRLVVTDSTLRDLLPGELWDGPVVPIVSVDDPEHLAGLAALTGAPLPEEPVAADDLFMLIFTSGTSGSPKAVRCSQGKIATLGLGLVARVDLTADDVTYLSMPLFHSNAVIAAWSPSVAVGACIALRRRFSASGFLPDVRRFQATYANYVGTPLSYVLAQPERPDDRDHGLTRVFGNEGAPADLLRFEERFGCQVIDGFGSTEGGISISRVPGTPQGSLGQGVGDIRVLDPETGEERAVARFDEAGRLLNADEAVGELVNADGAGAFEGYYGSPQEDQARLRSGWYWSGDLGYRDADGWLYHAGRSGDRLRVRGENLNAAPVVRLVARHPDVVEAAVYGVPDPVAGDRLVAALLLRADASWDPDGFRAWLAGQPDLSPTWVPSFVRLVAELPRTPTGKVLTRRLAADGWRGGDPLWLLDGDRYRPFTAADAEALDAEFTRTGRPLPLTAASP